jgi:hypothetical protein
MYSPIYLRECPMKRRRRIAADYVVVVPKKER